MDEHLSEPEILCEVRNHVAVITLNRAAALNALTLEMIDDLQLRLDACERDPQIRAVLMRGAGDKAFCAGGDIRALYRSIRDDGTLHAKFFTAEYRLDHRLHGYSKPYAALLDGITMGGGMGLAQASRLRLVGERTRMAMPEVGIGLFPDVGASYFLSRLPGALGTYLALTGVQVRGADAVYCGLADVFLAPAAVNSLINELDGMAWGPNSATDLATFVQARASGPPAPTLLALRAAIDTHFSLTSVPAILDALDTEARRDLVEWARQTAQLMRSRSPTMLSVALRQLQRGRNLTLAECFRMERGMIEQALQQRDFVEGVRALIIEKDNAPKWSPDRLDEVTDDSVDAFFRDRWRGGTHPLGDL